METAPLPPPSPELAVLRIFVQAYWRTLKPKERLKLQAAIIETIAELHTAPVVIRSPDDPAQRAVARAQGVAWVRRMMSDVLRGG